MKTRFSYCRKALFLFGLVTVSSCTQTEEPTAPQYQQPSDAKLLLKAFTTSCADAPAGLVSWWPGDGNANDIQGGNNGTLQNGATFVPGLVSQAFSLDGVNDFIDIANFSALDGSNSATFEFWINLHAIPSDPQCNSGSCASVLFSKNDFVLALSIHHTLAIEVSRGNGVNWGSPSHTLSDGTLTGLNQWNHVAVVVQGTTDEVYINGALVSSKMQDESAFANFSGLVLGSAFSGSYLFLNADLDEVSIYNRALTAAEVQAIYSAGSAGKCKITTVQIDIKPGAFPNRLNPKSKGVIPVTILSTASFDATTVDPLSVRFGPAGATEAHNKGHLGDVDGDGDQDVLLHFKTQQTGIQCGDTSASLAGSTFSGKAIKGTDSIQTVGCN